MWKPEVIVTVGGYGETWDGTEWVNIPGFTSEMVPAARGCSLPKLPQEATTNSLVTHIDTNGRKIVSKEYGIYCLDDQCI